MFKKLFTTALGLSSVFLALSLFFASNTLAISDNCDSHIVLDSNGIERYSFTNNETLVVVGQECLGNIPYTQANITFLELNPIGSPNTYSATANILSNSYSLITNTNQLNPTKLPSNYEIQISVAGISTINIEIFDPNAPPPTPNPSTECSSFNASPNPVLLGQDITISGGGCPSGTNITQLLFYESGAQVSSIAPIPQSGDSFTITMDSGLIGGPGVYDVGVNFGNGNIWIVNNAVTIIGQASTPVPAPPAPHPNEYVPCNKINEEFPPNSEFHTLRPYQASVCDPGDDEALRELDLYCGNDIILVHELELTLAQAQALATEPCVDDGNTITCDIILEDEEADIEIDLTDIELPIVGNTQLVPNQVNQGNPAPERLSYATRMNEYVSWYLHGATYKGDEELMNPFEINPIDLEQEYPQKQIITHAGPLMKLYPKQVVPGLLSYKTPKPRSDRIGITRLGWAHNQIFQCTSEGNQVPCRFNFATGSYGLLQDINGTPLDKGDDIFTQGVSVRRIRSSSAAESPWMVWSSTEDRLGAIFITNKIDNPIFGTEIQPTADEGNDGSVWDVKLIEQDDGTFVDTDLLYFPHMEETVTLVDLLQKTFVPKNIPKTTTDISGEGIEVAKSWRCDFKDVRWNSGDDLFGELGDDWLPGPVNVPETGQAVTGENIKVKVQYDTNFQCVFNYSSAQIGQCILECETDPNDDNYSFCNDPEGPYAGNVGACCQETCQVDTTCEVEIMTATQVLTRTPKVQELWDRTVAGTSSVVQRTLPKIGFHGMFEELKDYPGITTANYTTSTANYKVLAGEPGNKRDGSKAEVFIPHLGGIKIYFLDMVQDTLRPEEFNSRFLGSGGSGGQPPGSGKCSEGVGGCAISELESVFESNAGNASGICQVESGGYVQSSNISCLSGGTYDFSVGLFQLNLAPIPNYDDNGELVRLTSRCSVWGFPGAFVEDINDPSVHPNTRNTCVAIDDGTDCGDILPNMAGKGCNQALKACIQYTLDNNLELAYDISNKGTNWCPWSASGASYCANCF